MKKFKKLLKTAFILMVSTATLISCSEDDKIPIVIPTNSIVDFVSSNSDYSILLEALQTADGGIVETLNSGGPFTVFAPNNAAFRAFLSANNFDYLSDVPTAMLSQILLNHVVGGNALAASLSTGYDIKSFSTATPSGANMSLYINTADGVVINGVSTVTTADISLDNGTVHAVDAIIALPTVVTFAAADPNFSILKTALTRTDLTFDFVGTLSTANGTDPAPFTVFAPIDQAFVDLLEDLGASSLDDIDEPTLNATLKMHAVAGANVSASELSDDMVISTLGGDITANTTDGPTLTDSNERVSNIIAVNVQASNGVIHAIDKVLLATMPEPTNTIVDFVSNNDDYSILLEALQIADGDLDVVLSGDGPFTVFAPNNAAFTAFLSDNNFNALSDIPTDILSQVLLNHVVSGNAVSSSLSTGYDVSSLSTATPDGNNMSLYINTADGVVINGVSTVTTADVSVDNGTIHAVNTVIGLPTVVTFAVADPNFSILKTALTRADLTFDFVGTLSTANGTDPAPFTVFAPIDQAFVDLLEELEKDSLDDIDEETLNATLKMHAVAGANVLAAGLSDGLTISTLGGDITANLTGGATLTDANNRVSQIVAVDVQASNGVIHAIDKVLLK